MSPLRVLREKTSISHISPSPHPASTLPALLLPQRKTMLPQPTPTPLSTVAPRAGLLPKSPMLQYGSGASAIHGCTTRCCCACPGRLLHQLKRHNGRTRRAKLLPTARYKSPERCVPNCSQRRDTNRQSAACMRTIVYTRPTTQGLTSCSASRTPSG